MSDYEYCKKHDCNFLMPELLMCPICAVERLRAGDVVEPLGDALIEAIDTRDATIADLKRRNEELSEALRDEAQILRDWARESVKGGWSTHQVQPMQRRADVIDAVLAKNGGAQ